MIIVARRGITAALPPEVDLIAQRDLGGGWELLETGDFGDSIDVTAVTDFVAATADPSVLVAWVRK